MPDLAALQEDRELFEAAAATPGAVWGRCANHPDSPSMPYDSRRCWAGCSLPRTAADLLANTPPVFWGDLATRRPDLADEIERLAVERGEWTRS